MPHEGQRGVVFESAGHRLVGRLFLARGDEPKRTALILHGIPGIEQNHDLAHTLRDRGWNALVFHYRGCWGSEGNYAIRTILDDVRAAVDYLGSVREVDARHLAVVGHSLGGWAAVLAAAGDERLRAVAVYGAVAEPRWWQPTEEMIASQFAPWLGGVTAESLHRQFAELDDALSPVAQAHRVAPRPLLIVHGGKDVDLPPRHAEELHRRAREPKEVRVHPEANHAFTWHRPWLREQIAGWLGQHLQ